MFSGHELNIFNVLCVPLYIGFLEVVSSLLMFLFTLHTYLSLVVKLLSFLVVVVVNS